MTTYTIVSKDKDPLGPNEIHAGETISVSDGDVFLVDPTADGNLTFQAAGGVPAGFEIRFTGSNANGFDIKVEDDLTPTVTIGDAADLSDITLDAKAADELTFTAGDGVSFGKVEASVGGPNSFVIGDGFTTDADWKLGDAHDSFVVGADATFKNLDAGNGDDTLTFGDRASVHDFDTKSGDDSVTFGDALDANSIKTSDGNDTIRFGENAVVNSVDGGDGSDVFYTETEGLNAKNIESTLIVCYAPDTRVDTPFGRRRVDSLRIGDLVDTLDAGPCRVRWRRSGTQHFDGVADDRRPVRIRAGALGPGRPETDLVVSPQHRILVGGHDQLTGVFRRECFVPAKALTGLPGVAFLRGRRRATWVHFALDRHHVVRVNGLLSETLYLDPMVMRSLSLQARGEISALFGTMPRDGRALNGPPARPILTAGAARRALGRAHRAGSACAVVADHGGH